MNGMVEGQVLDIALLGGKKSELDYLKRVNMKKTAMLIGASVSSGVLLVSGSGKMFRTVHDYGLNLGMAFQLMDDLLDMDRNEPSIPAIYGEEVAKKELLGYIKKSRHLLRQIGKNAWLLDGIINYIFGGVLK
jgi:geranylgeranyl pyrophosphate synthase